jgi:hypothetical protein
VANYIKYRKSITYSKSYARRRKLRKVLKDKSNDYLRSIGRVIRTLSENTICGHK